MSKPSQLPSFPGLRLSLKYSSANSSRFPRQRDTRSNLAHIVNFSTASSGHSAGLSPYCGTTTSRKYSSYVDNASARSASPSQRPLIHAIATSSFRLSYVKVVFESFPLSRNIQLSAILVQPPSQPFNIAFTGNPRPIRHGINRLLLGSPRSIPVCREQAL